MKKSLDIALVTLFCICFVIFVRNNQKESTNTAEYFQSMILDNDETKDNVVNLLKVYKITAANESVELIRLGKNNDGGYVVPVLALEKSDALMGYGIADDISFEREFSQRFDKPSFGFDGGVPDIETGDNRCHFYSECIGEPNYLYAGQQFSGRMASYSDQLKRLKLEDKKIFIKMDIEGAEFDVFDDILKHTHNITGIVLECHMNRKLHKAEKLLSQLNKDFVLLHVHGNNYCLSNSFTSKNAIGSIPYIIELTYINKNLISSYEISQNQKHPKKIDQPNCPDRPDFDFEILL